MVRKVLLSICLSFIACMVNASQPQGRISSISFFGSGASEVIFVVLEPNESDCPYTGHFVMYTKDRPAITAGLLAAFQAQNNVQVFGTGACDTSWSNHEVINYATFTK